MPDIDPQVIIIFIVMLVGGVRALIEKFNTPKPGAHEEFEDPSLEEFFDQQREEILERQRRKLSQLEEMKREQAVGGPQAPPPIPQRRREVPRQAAPVPQPVPAQIPQQAPRQLPQEVRRPVLSKAEKEALARVQAGSIQGGAIGEMRGQKKSGARQSVVDFLRSPQSARDAILLTEVLGKPKGVQ